MLLLHWKRNDNSLMYSIILLPNTPVINFTLYNICSTNKLEMCASTNSLIASERNVNI